MAQKEETGTTASLSFPEPHIEPSPDVLSHDTDEIASNETTRARGSSAPEQISVLIIGAGPTGLGAAYRLKELGNSDFLILERSQNAGGLASSFKDPKGFWWDVGGHVQFSHYHQFDQAMFEAIPPDGWLQHQRVSAVRMYDTFVPYFFQNNIGFLPPEPMKRCLDGLEKLVQETKGGKSKEVRNFEDWIHASFGEGIAQEFMLPYNFKVWAYPPRDMNHTWVGDRVATVDLERVKRNIENKERDVNWGPNATFGFPLHGGTGQIWRTMSKHIQNGSGTNSKIRFGSRVISVDVGKQIVELDDGSRIRYQHLISTMPVDKLIRMTVGDEGKLDSARQKVKDLKYSSTNIVGIGLEGTPSEELAEMCWMYFPESNSDFYRVTLFSKYSPNNVPDAKRQFSLMCEVSESPVKPVNRSNLVSDTIRGLLNTKLISENDKVISAWQYSVDYGYPTPSVERDGILGEIIPPLDELNIYSRGRFGGWKYEVGNQDHSFAQGYEAVQRILEDIPEFTYRLTAGYDPNGQMKGGKKLDLVTRELR